MWADAFMLSSTIQHPKDAHREFRDKIKTTSFQGDLAGLLIVR